MKRLGIRTAVRGLMATVVIWAVLAIAADWHGADWPHRTPNIPTCFNRATFQVTPDTCEFFSSRYQWASFLIVGMIVEFLWLKAWMMWSMTRVWDHLGASLVAANVAFSVVYLYAMASLLFPSWGMQIIARDIIRYGLLAVLLWGIVQLLLVPDADDDPHPPAVYVPSQYERTAEINEQTARTNQRTANTNERTADRAADVMREHGGT